MVDICDDMLDDYPFMYSEITNLVKSSMELKIDNDLLLGYWYFPIINGIAKYASTFDAQHPEQIIRVQRQMQTSSIWFL